MPKNACFVIMPFGPPFDRYFKNVFVPAIEDAGLQAIRADSIFLPSAIMQDIWRFVNEARVLVADLTGRNPNVFYELGLAHALQKPVILVTNNFDDVRPLRPPRAAGARVRQGERGLGRRAAANDCRIPQRNII
jgi:hypothetical protein